MSYLTVLTAKVPYSRFSYMEREIERSPDYGCLDGHIDDAETKNNYHIIYPKGSYKDLGSPYVAKDANGKRRYPCMMTIIVSSDDSFFERFGDAMRHQFFEDAAKYFLDTFGARNVFSAVVHMDEGAPHMHVCFFPYDSCGKLLALAEKPEGSEAAQEFQEDIYEKLGERYNMEFHSNVNGTARLVHSEYLQARAMYRYMLEVQDITREIQGKRDELFSLQDDVESVKKTRDAVKREVRDLTQTKEALQKEQKRLQAEVLRDTDYHAGMDSFCSLPDPSKSKDESIRILKARLYAMQETLSAEREDSKDVLERLKASEAKLKAASQYKEKADIADAIRTMYPEIYYAAERSAKSRRKQNGMSAVRSADTAPYTSAMQ